MAFRAGAVQASRAREDRSSYDLAKPGVAPWRDATREDEEDMMKRKIVRRALAPAVLAVTVGLGGATGALGADPGARHSDPLAGLRSWVVELWHEASGALTAVFAADTTGNGPHPGSSGPGEGDGYNGGNGDHPHPGNSPVKPRKGGAIDPDGAP